MNLICLFLIWNSKKAITNADALFKSMDQLEQRLRAYKYAESVEFERLVRGFDERFSKCFKSMLQLLAAINKMHTIFDKSNGPIEDQLKEIEKRADLSKLIFLVVFVDEL